MFGRLLNTKIWSEIPKTDRYLKELQGDQNLSEKETYALSASETSR